MLNDHFNNYNQTFLKLNNLKGVDEDYYLGKEQTENSQQLEDQLRNSMTNELANFPSKPETILVSNKNDHEFH